MARLSNEDSYQHMNHEDKIKEVYQYLINNKIKPSKQDSFITRAEIAFFVLSILCFAAFIFIGLFIAKYRNIGFALAAMSIVSLLIFLFVKEIFVAIVIGIYTGAISRRLVVADIEELSRFVKEAANKSKQRGIFTMPEK